VWTNEGQEIREPRDLQTEVGPGPIGPFVYEALPALPSDVDAVERARDRIEAGGINDDVELVLGIAGLDALGRDSLDRHFPEIDQQHIALIVDFVLVGLQGYAPGTAAMIPGTQLFGDLRIADPFRESCAG